jgi:hypothetical protein
LNRNGSVGDEDDTMIKRVAILVFALLPVGASAQALPVPVRTGPPAGITVVGHGSLRVPVQTLQFTAFTRGDVDDAAVLAALRAAGVVDPSIGPAGASVSSNAGTVLRGTITAVTREKLDRIAHAAADFVHQHPGSSVDNSKPEQAARTAALADARRKAQAIAALSGLSIGGIDAISETGGCPALPDGPPAGPGLPFDLATLTTMIAVYDTVTYAIAPPNGARRRTL